MQRRTFTTAGQLRVGDIFHYPKQEDQKFQVTDQTRSHTHINRPNHNGGFISQYDDLISHNKQVVFLRHTRPITGETFYVQDLRVGDVFHFPDDIINEYTKTVNGIVAKDGTLQPPLPLLKELVFVRSDSK